MGLGIEACSKAVLVTTDLDDEDAEGDYWVDGPDNPLYLDGYPKGIYKIEGESMVLEETLTSDYFKWLAELSRFALDIDLQVIWDNPETYTNHPFYSLFYASNFEEAIGPITSRKLAQDFADHSDRIKSLVQSSADSMLVPANDFIELYDQLQEAFTLASDNGFVNFQ